MEKKPKTIVLIDGNALIHRAYHALPPLTTKTGETVQAVYGFVSTLLSVLDKFKPDYIAASFDLEGPTFRDELYDEYKAQREKAPDDLYAQIPRVKEVVQAFNIPIYELPKFEADDAVGTLARQAEKAGVNVIIVTGDTDTLQLVTEHVKVFTLRKGLKDMVLLGISEVKAKYGFGPERLTDYKGLRGDASDNIPGVKGVGEKTATDLIQEFGSLENIYASLPKIKEKVREKLEADKEMAILSKKLGTIDTAVPLKLDLAACVTHDFNPEKIGALLRELEFFSLLKRLPGAKVDDNEQGEKSTKKTSKKKETFLKTKKEAEEFFRTLKKETALVVLEKQASLFGGGIEVLGLATREGAWIVEWNEATTPPMKKFLEDGDKKKIVHDAKKLWHTLAPLDIHAVGVTSDTMLLAYVLNPGGKVDFETLLLEKLGKDSASLGLSEQAGALVALSDELMAGIEKIAAEQEEGKTIRTVLGNIEMPLTPLLYDMEVVGVRLNKNIFKELSRELNHSIQELEKKIATLAGRDFNLNSPKQLAEVLFGDLKIPTEGIKKNKTGYSTASTELVKLRADYPIIEFIESYRELFKLKTTYIDVLPTLVKEDGRLHTTFGQAVAATGRLSSSDPNLQNIPIKTEWGERLRVAFEAAPGYKLVGADYSQIELRIAAHLSGDKNMLEAFRKGEDIHQATAALVHGVKPEEVTPAMRREAKVLNFGIIYGMGAFGLSQAARIDQKAASEFIKNYLKKFSGVARYMEDMKKFAHEKGYVETELGRRRYLPEIGSSNTGLVRGAERMAINMPVQGLAADIMKLAMLASRPLLVRYTDSAKLLLQIHDEIIFEVKEEKAEAFARELKQVMEGVYPLKVPLLVSTDIGDNWGEI
ncbi:MAG: DNA polymerase I [Candidatus Moraniibacteriota bacterium]